MAESFVSHSLTFRPFIETQGLDFRQQTNATSSAQSDETLMDAFTASS